MGEVHRCCEQSVRRAKAASRLVTADGGLDTGCDGGRFRRSAAERARTGRRCRLVENHSRYTISTCIGGCRVKRKEKEAMKPGKSGAKRSFEDDDAGGGWGGEEAPRNKRGGVSTSAPARGGAGAAQRMGRGGAGRSEETREERIFRRAEAMDDGDDSELEEEGDEDDDDEGGEEDDYDDVGDGADRAPAPLQAMQRIHDFSTYIGRSIHLSDICGGRPVSCGCHQWLNMPTLPPFLQ